MWASIWTPASGSAVLGVGLPQGDQGACRKRGWTLALWLSGFELQKSRGPPSTLGEVCTSPSKFEGEM